MKFTDCNFSACCEVEFLCLDCSHYDSNGVSNVIDPIHPILGIPLSQLPDEETYLKGQLLPFEVKDTLPSSPVQLEFDFKD